MKYHCPECESDDLLVYERTAYELNTGNFYCHSVKSHDAEAKVSCQDCEWEGFLNDILIKMTTQKVGY